MRWSDQKRMQNGKFITCNPAYGYDLVEGKLKVDTEQVEIVRYIFSEYLTKKSSVDIAEKLIQIGIPTKNGSIK